MATPLRQTGSTVYRPAYDRAAPRAAVARAQGPSTTLTTLLVAALTLLAAALRLGNSAGQSLRLDEAFSVRWASWPLTPVLQAGKVIRPSLFQATASDVHPPGYLLLLHVWMQAFGTSVTALRLPSEVAGTLAVPALYLLASSLYGRAVGLFAVLLGALSPFWIWHAQEARMYPFLLLFTILGTYGFVQALEYRRRWGWVVLFLASVGAIYAQYFAFLVLLTQALFLLLYRRHYTRGQLWAWVGTMALLALTYVPWVLIFLKYHHGASDPNLQKPDFYSPLTILIGFLFGYLTGPITSGLLAAWPLLVPLSLAMSVFAGPVERRGALLWLLFLVPLVVAFAVSVALFPFISERYLVVCTPALYTMAAVALARFRKLTPRVLAATVCAVVLLSCWRVAETNAANPSLENYRDVVSYVDAHARPGDAVALDAYYNEDIYLYYARTNLPVYDLPLPPTATGRSSHLDAPTLSRYLSGIEAGHRRLWVIYYLETNNDPPGPGHPDGLVRYDLAYYTAKHRVIYGGPYHRDQPGYPSSYTSVQLVRYDLIQRTAHTLYTRPITMQQRRALTYLGPTTLRPFAAPFGAPGARGWLLHGPTLVMPYPARAWHFAPLAATSRPVHLTLFNPNRAAIDVTVSTRGHHGTISKWVRVPASSNREIVLASWLPGARNAASSLVSAFQFVPLRSAIGRGDTELDYGLLGFRAGAARRSAAPVAVVRHGQVGGGSLAVASIGAAGQGRARSVTTATAADRRRGGAGRSRSIARRRQGGNMHRTVVVTAAVLFVRAAPSTTHTRILGLRYRGNRLRVIGQRGRWDEILLRGNTHGWVSARWVR